MYGFERRLFFTGHRSETVYEAFWVPCGGLLPLIFELQNVFSRHHFSVDFFYGFGDHLERGPAFKTVMPTII